ncbi:MAG TPA: hypothetical protein VFY73_17855 [Ideonella sp.]|nr:hypothetical protein [Ideonella sp.]
MELAQQHFANGRLVATIGLLAPMERSGLPIPLVASIDHLHCVAAFRLGELDDSLRRARSFLERVDPGVESALEQRFAVLAVAVVAAGELALYERCLDLLTELLGLACRIGGLAHYVRARGTAASAFLLLGDLWAAQRILAVLTSEFDQPHSELRLEATMRCNHASLCLQLARMARDAADPEAAQQAIEDAAHSVERAVLAADGLQDLRIVTFVDLHQVELSMLQGDGDKARSFLAKAMKGAQAAGLNAHWRHLDLLQAEMLLNDGSAQPALDILDGLRQSEGTSNELNTRLRQRELEYRALHAAGRDAEALEARAAFDKLHAYRSFRQARAQSTLMRKRLELEHLFRRGSEGAGFGEKEGVSEKRKKSPPRPSSRRC